MSATTSSQPAARKQDARRSISWNRVLHRSGGLLVSLLMLYMAVTGVSMQVLDLDAILTHAPASNETVRSMEEGMYGNADFAVIQVSDFSAPPLPAELDTGRALATVLAAAHRNPDAGIVPVTLRDGVQILGPDSGLSSQHANAPVQSPNSRPDASQVSPEGPAGSRGQSSAPAAEPAPVAWVELRVAHGIPIGQVMTGHRLSAFNARTGDAVPPVLSMGLPRGNSLRERLKKLHRFWDRADTPGVYFELLSGLLLWMLIITGLIMYFRMLRARVKQRRAQPFWMGGSLWRSLHRVISVGAAVFLICIAFTGTWLGFESVVNSLRRGEQPGTVDAARIHRNASDFIVPLRDEEVQEMAANTLTATRLLHPNDRIKVIRLRVYGQMKQGVVVGGEPTTQWVFNAENGAPVDLSSHAYPDSGFPFGTQVHENIKHFHSGEMFGLPTRAMNLLAGFSLAFLSISGLFMYVEMWSKRRRTGRASFLWA